MNTAVDLLLSHKLEHARALLAGEKGIGSATKPELRKRLRQAIRRASLSLDAVMERVDAIEGWGNQHIYFYKAPEALSQAWRVESHVRSVLGSAKKVRLFNARLALVMPETWTLSTVRWSPQSVRFVWVGTRTWEERVAKEDKSRGDRLWKAYRRRRSRGVMAFDWDLDSYNAMLMIQRLPSGDDYPAARDALRAEMGGILDPNAFESIRVGRAIKSIEDSGEARNRQLGVRTPRGTGVKYTSASRNSDAFDDPRARASRESLGDDVAGDLGNFYWEPGDAKPLVTDLHTTVYAKDHRVGIFGERTEEEVRYVVSRIRFHCA